jgi:hypothetical protein
MSGKMAAIVAYVLDIPAVSDPAIDDMTVTSDGAVLAQNEGDVGFNAFIGHVSDLRRNWSRLLEVTTDLTAKERAAVNRLFRQKIGVQAGLDGLSGEENQWVEVDWDEAGKAQGWVWQSGIYKAFIWHYEQRPGGMDFLWRWRLDLTDVDGAPEVGVAGRWEPSRRDAILGVHKAVRKHMLGLARR